jgi:hypothetical protein
MRRKYVNPKAHGYLLEAKACTKIIKELRRIAVKLEKAVSREADAREAEFQNVMQYTSEQQIQDDYGWDFITEAQYERYLDLFREGMAAVEHHEFTVNEVALSVIRRIISDIDEDRREWEFSALTPEQQIAERERAERSQRAWKEKIAEIKRKRGMLTEYSAMEEDQQKGGHYVPEQKH